MNVGKHEVENQVITAEMTFTGLTRRNVNPVAINATAVATTTEILSGVITSTSGAAVAITTPAALAMALALNASKYSSFDIVVDNSAGSNAVTFVAGANTTLSTTNSVAAGKIGLFKVYFTSITVASEAISAATAVMVQLG